MIAWFPCNKKKSSTPKTSAQQKKINLAPGKSVCGTDFKEADRISVVNSDKSDKEDSDYVVDGDSNFEVEAVEEDDLQPLQPILSSDIDFFQQP